jgi:hypothetical protein
MAIDQKLVHAFYLSALWQIDMIQNQGAKGEFCSNVLREFARFFYGCKFKNELSPLILDEVVRQHPALGAWIKTKTHKPDGFDYVPALAKLLVPTTTKKKLM